MVPIPEKYSRELFKQRSLFTAISLLGMSLSLLSVPAEAVTLPTHATTKDVAGFPVWYQDANGVRVEPCYDPNDANCAAPVNASYDPAQPLAFPGNYPTEFFYSAADSDLVVVNDGSCPNFVQQRVPAGGKGSGSRIHMALEAAFLNGTLTPGDQMLFGRLRVISTPGNGLCPTSWYTFRTPYGPYTLQTDANAEIQGAIAANATYDVGCLPGPASPCNFDLALGAPVLGVGLLRQVNIPAPGYLGSGVAVAGAVPALNFDTVTGGLNGFNQFDVVKWPQGVTPPLDANGNITKGYDVDCTDAACTVLGSTNQFTVAAKLAGPVGAVNKVDFGGQVADTTSAAQSIALTNLGSGPLGKDAGSISYSISGAYAGDFTVTNINCPTTALARDASCNVAVNYTPAAANPSNASVASLDVAVTGSPVVKHIALNGTRIQAGQAPVANYVPAGGTVNFGQVRLSAAGSLQVVTVLNSGSAPLLAQPGLTGSPAFSIAYDNCSPAYVPVGGSCQVGLNFIPTSVAPFSAQLQVVTNAANGNFTWTVSGSGIPGTRAVSPTNNAINTFPDWYQDDTGLRVGQCDDPANTLCIASPVAGLVTFPTNYPNEWFYYHAQSVPMAVSDCGLAPGTMFVEAGMEGAFLGAPPVIAPNGGITFGRLRIISRGGGLCPNTSYLLTHPYGQATISTDANGNIKPTAGTTDVGCLAAPCDYTIALNAPVFDGFLKQSGRPAGYLGNPLNPSTVTGAPFLDPATAQPANYFKVERLDQAGVGQPVAFTTEFGVSGRLVGPMIVSPAIEEFGTVQVATTSAAVTRSFIFSNDGPFNVTLAASNPLTVQGVNFDDFVLQPGSTCTAGLVLAHGQTCAADVTFLARNTGNRSASLILQHNGGNNPLAASLHGIGGAQPGVAAISASVSTLHFTDLKIGVKSETATITLSNAGGNANLAVVTPTISAGAPFLITGNTCSTVFVTPGETCQLSLQFQPTLAGNYSATLTIPSNAGTGSLSIPVTGKSTNVAAAQSASVNNAGLPSWYQDRNGVRVEPCLAQDGNCVLLADASFNPSLPVAWPGNFPGESFYSLADSEVIATPADASCGAAGGLALLRVATEASFAVLPPTLGGQLIFNRIRIVAGGLCPNTSYNFIHPYGTSTIVTDAAGSIRPKDGTFDNTAVLTSAPVTPGFLQWDPNVAPAAPVGYLGDARTLHPVVGSQYRPVVGGEPANYFKIVRVTDNKVAGETRLFTVSGRLAGPVVSSLDGKDFGSLQVGSTSTTQSFVISNVGSTPVTGFTTPVLGGSPTSSFAIASNTCTATTTLATDGTCTIQVQFKPTAVGSKQETLTLGYSGLRSPLSILLKGMAVAVQTPALTVTPTTLAFGNVLLNTTSTVQKVTIRNSGTGNLRLGTLAISGANPGQYAIVTNAAGDTVCQTGPTATALTPGNSCIMTVAFKPTLTTGSKPATITVSATDAVTTTGHVAVAIPSVNVGLSGSGASAVIGLSASTVSFRAGTAGTTSTAKVTITNNGVGANLSVTGFTSSKANWSMSFTGCAAVAPGKNCTGTISWVTPSTIAVGATDAATLNLVSNASNSPTITATGTRSR